MGTGPRLARYAIVPAVIAILMLAVAGTADATSGQGSTILFERVGPDGTTHLYTMDGDGDNQSLLLADAADGDYAPDGRRIAFDRSSAAAPPDIFVARADGTAVQRLTDHPGFDFFPDWSHDGRQILFISDRSGRLNVHVMSPDGTNVRQLTDDPQGVQQAAYSPDGRRIAFVSFRSGVPQIFVMDSDGGNPTRLTDGPDFELSWSPDGQRMAFISFRDGRREVYLMDSDGGNPIRLTDDGNRDLGPVEFSPNGQEIAFMSQRQGNFDVYAMSVRDGSERRLTTDPAVDGFPEWRHGTLAAH